MIKIYYNTIKKEHLNVIDNFRAGVWINVANPDEEEISRLVKELKVDRDLIKDGLDENEVPRMEEDNGFIYIFVRVPEKIKNEIFTVPLLIVIGGDFLMTLSKKECNVLKNFSEQKIKFFTTQKIKFFMQLLFSINNSYNYYINSINRNIRSLKSDLQKISNPEIVKFVDIEQILNDFLSALIPMNSFLEKLMSGKQVYFYEEDKDLVEDVFLSNGQLILTSKASLKNVVNIRNAYSNLMTYDLNKTMKMLTAITVLLTVPTMIFSFYGMNINLPFSGSTHATFIVIILTLAISISLFFIFVKNKWF